MKTEAEARERGKKMLAEVGGKGWTLDVWRNTTWHCALRSSYLAVHYNEDADDYTVFVNDDGKGGSGDCFKVRQGLDRLPSAKKVNWAIRRRLNSIRVWVYEEHERLVKVLTEIDEQLEIGKWL